MTLPELNRIYTGDCLEIICKWPDSFVQTVVTSPPYWGLRDYGVDGQIGLEDTPEAYVASMVEVFHGVKRILRDDGTLWLNLGDSYFGANWRGSEAIGTKQSTNRGANASQKSINPQTWRNMKHGTLKPKDLVGIPWRVAFALQADGWYLRSDIIWSKPNVMPESVTDRPTKAHEYLFLLAKSERYFYDADAIKEKAIYFDIAGMDQTGYKDAESFNGKHHKTDKQRGHGRRHAGFNDRWDAMKREDQCSGMRNKRDVWTVATFPFSEAHFATFPSELIAPCVMAGSMEQGIVMDPFMGAGTTALVASQYNRQFLGIELNPDYVAIAEKRIANEKAQVKMAL